MTREALTRDKEWYETKEKEIGETLKECDHFWDYCKEIIGSQAKRVLGAGPADLFKMQTEFQAINNFIGKLAMMSGKSWELRIDDR